MSQFYSDDHFIYYCRQVSLRRRNGVVFIVNKRVQSAVFACNLKNNRIISVCFQGKPFTIMVIRIYAQTSSAEEAEVECFYEDIQELLLELTHPKDVLFIIGNWNTKSKTRRNIWSNRQIWTWSTK